MYSTCTCMHKIAQNNHLYSKLLKESSAKLNSDVHTINVLLFVNFTLLVDDFREVSLLLLRSHDVSGRGAGGQGRVEFLPVQWHSALHGDDTGVDK